MKKNHGITLIALIVTIIILIILAGISIGLIAGSNGLLEKSAKALDENDEATATEKMELKITYLNMISYGESTRKANLQELAEGMFQDKEIDYVKVKEQKVASLEAIDVTGENSIFVKLKDYPYEFEIDNNLHLASVDGVRIAASGESQKSQEELSPKEYIYPMTTSWTTIGETITLENSIKDYDLLVFQYSCKHKAQSEYSRGTQKILSPRSILYNNSEETDVISEINLENTFIEFGNTVRAYQITGWFKDEKNFFVQTSASTGSNFTSFKIEQIYGIKF